MRIEIRKVEGGTYDVAAIPPTTWTVPPRMAAGISRKDVGTIGQNLAAEIRQEKAQKESGQAQP